MHLYIIFVVSLTDSADEGDAEEDAESIERETNSWKRSGEPLNLPISTTSQTPYTPTSLYVCTQGSPNCEPLHKFFLFFINGIYG